MNTLTYFQFMQESTKVVPLVLYTSDLPSSPDITTTTVADDTAILAIHPNPAIALQKLQNNLDVIQHWLSLWRLKANGFKSTHVTFINRRKTCPVVCINNGPLPQAEDVEYLRINLDKRLIWHKHIFTKRKHLGMTLTKLYWLLGRRSQLNLRNKLLIYKVAIKPIWTYGIQLWGAASTSNIEILERFQPKTLRLITDAPCMFQMPLFGVTYKSHLSKKKFVASAPSTTLDSAPNPTS
jgi:hypothetical protein